MIEVSVQHLGDVAFEVTARGHALTSDQPVENHGQDSGMTPVELLLASLGTCGAFYGAQYLRARDLPTEGLSVRVVGEKGGTPVRVHKIRIEVTAPPLPEQHLAGLRRAIDACLIHRTLQHPPEVSVELLTPAEVPADQV